jgi:hypothetical protein
MPATALQLPFVNDPAAQTGRKLWRKRILPVGIVKHPEHDELVFDASRLAGLRESYLQGAMDQVPFVLVDAANRHTDDPERFRGDVKGLENRSDGLYATIETTEDGTKVLKDNPNLPVSVRLKTLADGREVLAHVAGTFDPVATKMGPWESIDASNDLVVMDFSDRGSFTLPGVTDTSQAEKDATAADALSKEEVGKFRSFLQGLKPSGEQKQEPPPELSEADLAALLAGTDEPADEEKVPATASLSDEDRKTIDLANSRADRIEQKAGKLELSTRLLKYVEEGVPPALVDAARGVLEADRAAIIDFSDGKTPDVATPIFEALDKAKGTIDFSEKGTTAATVIDLEDEKTKSLQKAADELAKGYI